MQKMLFSTLACGVVLFPGLFFSFRAVLKRLFTHWSDADVVSVSERLLSAVHATLATAAGVTVVMSCADVMTDKYERSQYRSLSDLVPTKDVSILCV